jgi:hypothetical protein
MRAYDHPVPLCAITLGFALAVACGTSVAQESFSEVAAYVEINATDGDIGFHALLDADAWSQVRLDDPSGKRLFHEQAKGSLAEQGLTENFFESDEPLCAAALAEDEDDEIVTLAEFLQRFPAGYYVFTGKSNEGDMLASTALVTHDLPAAPDIEDFDGTGNVDTGNAIIDWAPGGDLGECPFDVSIPAPGAVPVVLWEIVVEPENEEAVAPLRVFSVQLPSNATSVTVPAEFLESYVAQGVTVFKFEVGAIEASGNRTFSEGIFCTTECADDE